MIKKILISIILLFVVLLPNVKAQNNGQSMHFPVNDTVESPLYLKDPSNITTTVEYDAEKNTYVLYKKVGDVVLESHNLTFEEYQKYDMDRMIDNYWKSKNNTSYLSSASGQQGGGLSSIIPQMRINSDLFETIFGGQDIVIRPSGSLDLKFAMVNNRNENMSLSENKRSTTRFDFDEDFQLNVMAQIGTAINFNLNYNTGATFDFEKELMKLKYEGKEDDIVQLLEAGNISFSLPTTLITGVQNLFGLRSKLKFGNLMIDAVISQQKSESSSVTIQNGAQTQEFNFRADNYDDNKHFFLAQYFYDNYNKAMETFPVLNSNIIITKVEVWKTNVGSAVNNNRNIVAFADLGENKPFGTTPYITDPNGNPYPEQNTSNTLLQTINKESLRNINNVSSYLQGMGFVSGQNFEKVESARKLNSSEYTVNNRLGFISLNQSLSNDQVLAVAFQYQIVGDSTVYQVGEFSDDGVADPNTLVVKLLKSSTLNVRNPMWKLMMKNVYWLGSSQIAKEDFRFNVMYLGDEEGVETGYYTDGPFKGIPLLQIFDLDRMDNQQNMYPDGVFDFVDGAQTSVGTISAGRGLVFFPKVEPFGKDLRERLADNEFADKYCFDSLYTLTKSQAMQYTEKDKYYLEGRYRSSSSGGEISLGAVNVPQGSVTVMAGGIKLQEGVDYTVDYAMGRVRILNNAYLSSGTPITVSTESNTTFSMTSKRMLGVRGTYTVSPELSFGATVMKLHESPVTTKVNYGDEPISNTLLGFDMRLTRTVPFITKILNMLPFYETKTASNLSFEGEVAGFFPGNSSAIGRTGTSYIDDFETSKRSYDLKSSYMWHLASTPQDFNSSGAMFPETFKNSGLAYGFNRAKLAWYVIDESFYNGGAPNNINNDDLSEPYARMVLEREVYPNKDQVGGQPTTIRTLDLAFYPKERGPYNYDTTSVWSAGLNADGELNDPESRWGGIMRKIDATDFDAANIEYIEFWLMDPFIDNEGSKGGKLYFNLGDISEDILRDGRKSYENGLPTSAEVSDVDTTVWGRVPKLQAVVNAFSNEDNSRQYQDIGYDGLNSEDERMFFSGFLSKIQTQLSAEAYQRIVSDPSADDFTYFRNSDYDQSNVKVVSRYKRYNNAEGNSSVTTSGESTQATSLPNVEDINQDNTLSEAENYYEYEIDLAPDRMNVGENFITDVQTARNVTLKNGKTTDCKWYQFRIPVREPSRKVGTIEGYQSIRFIRTFLRGFQDSVILRFATFELVSAEWRKYTDNMLSVGAYPSGTNPENTTFSVGTVNIEENGKRLPVPYCLPPGIDRELMYSSSTTAHKQNEQSMLLKVSNLADGDARAVYKTMDYDMRQYRKLKLFVHGEQLTDDVQYKDGEVSLFLRIGADFISNYYEYEMPVKLTPWYTSSADDKVIWPEDNDIEIDLDSLVKVKEHRNKLVRSGDKNYANNEPYTEYKNGRKITVLGSPDIANVKVFMIGVRNPKKQSINDDDDMLPKSVEVWVNELRLTDFNKRPGWAARGSLRTNLADLGDLALSGSYRSAGFGTIEQKIATISQDNIGTFDIATNLELGKFFPERYGVRIPLHYDYSKSVSNPRYNPLDPDVTLKEDLLSYRTEKERDSIRHMVQDYSSITNFSLMNLRKERMGESALKRHFYDIENFNLSYSYSHIYRRSVDIEYNTQTQNRFILNYQYESQTKGWKPFAKIPLFKGKSWAILRDFTFNYIPKSLSFRSDMMRDFQETLLRSKSAGLVIMEPYFYKNFYWNREYGMKYDITNSLRMEYSATMNALIEEPRGRIDTKEKRDSLYQNIYDLGKAQQFNQKVQLNYTLPINKIPFFNWLRANGSYTAQYSFQASTNATESLGNTIENSRRITASATATLSNLYTKIPLVKKAYEERDKKNPQKNAMPKRPMRQGLNQQPTDTTASKDSVEKKNILKDIMYFSVRLLTSVKTASITYTLNDGTYIPGFMPVAKYFGMSSSQQWAPGWQFVLGSQKDIMPNAVRSDWITTDTMFNSAVIKKRNEMINAQMKIELFKDFNIDLSFKRTQSWQHSSYYKYNNELGMIDGPVSPSQTGNYSISVIAISTLFKGMDKNNVSSTFEKFLSNRQTVAERLAEKNRSVNEDYGGYPVWDTLSNQYWPDGYGSNSQQVLIPAFLAAYLGKDAGKQSLNPFIKMPMPNWRISWTGLGKKDWVKKWANSVTISSNYTANYNISSYYTNTSVPDVSAYDYGTEWVRSTLNRNFIAKHVMDQLMISEQLSPLLKVDVNLKNSFQFNMEIRKERSLSLSFANNQLTEINRTGFVLGGGYRFKDVRISIRTGEQSVRDFRSDIQVKADLTITSNKTMLRKIDQGVNLISAGTKVATLNLSGEYSLSEKVILKAFFDMTINTPFISSSYPTSTTEGGISLKIIL